MGARPPRAVRLCLLGGRLRPRPRFGEEPAHEAPLTGYGRSKWLFDQRVRAALPAASGQVVGLRYFNVYGPGEAHKGAMASIVFHLHGACRAGRPARLFGASHGWAAGEQRRDFVHVADVVAVTEWFLEHPARSGIFNVGTGTSTSFNELARLVLARCGGGEGIEYVPMPPAVRDGYQSYTCADLARLRRAGYEAPFQPGRVEGAGIPGPARCGGAGRTVGAVRAAP